MTAHRYFIFSLLLFEIAGKEKDTPTLSSVFEKIATKNSFFIPWQVPYITAYCKYLNPIAQYKRGRLTSGAFLILTPSNCQVQENNL